MNWHKMRSVLELIRSQGDLPRDEWGNVLSEDDLLAWFGLDKELTFEEQMQVRKKLAKMAQAQAFMDRVRLNAP